MSRYNIYPRDPANADLELCVGYDQPLSTLFAHVIKPGPPEDLEIEDEYILMVGNRLNEIKSVDELAHLVSRWSDIPSDIKRRLISDMAKPYERSALQNWMIKEGLVY